MKNEWPFGSSFQSFAFRYKKTNGRLGTRINDQLSKLENLVEKLTNQASQLASNENDSNNVNICSNCKKGRP